MATKDVQRDYLEASTHHPLIVILHRVDTLAAQIVETQ